MLDIWQATVNELNQGRDCILATILSVRGSSPRHVGTRFFIRWDGRTVGTIGGGLFESQVQVLAAEAFKNRTSCRAVFSFTGKDHESAQMICGGEVDVLVEFVDASDQDLLVLFSRLLASTRERGAAFLFTGLPMPVGGAVPGSLKRLLVEADGTRTGGFPRRSRGCGIHAGVSAAQAVSDPPGSRPRLPGTPGMAPSRGHGVHLRRRPRGCERLASGFLRALPSGGAGRSRGVCLRRAFPPIRTNGSCWNRSKTHLQACLWTGTAM